MSSTPYIYQVYIYIRISNKGGVYQSIAPVLEARARVLSRLALHALTCINIDNGRHPRSHVDRLPLRAPSRTALKHYTLREDACGHALFAKMVLLCVWPLQTWNGPAKNMLWNILPIPRLCKIPGATRVHIQNN